MDKQTKEKTYELAKLLTEGPNATILTLRKIIRLGIKFDLMLAAIVGVIEPFAAQKLKEAIQAEAVTGEPLPESRKVKRVSPIERIKLLLLADLPPETAMLLIADVVMPKETAAAIGGSIVNGVWVPENLLGDVQHQAVVNA